jgi:methylmalonyl-CoA/ethylmalonyl-CoA epimerase
MNTQAGLQITGVAQATVMVDDLGRAHAFYRDVLGLTSLFEVPGMAFLMAGGLRLLLGHEPDPEKRKHCSILYFRVDDAARGEAYLRALGVAIETPAHLVARMPDHELWIAFFRDSEGNVMGLLSEQRPKA